MYYLTKKPLLPCSSLVLYAKGWLNFNIKRPKWDRMQRMRYIINMCDYIPCKNPYLQVLNCVEVIKNFVDEYNKNFDEPVVHFPKTLCSLFSFEAEVSDNMKSYSCSHDEAVVITVLAELMTLDIRPFSVEWIDYYKKPYTLGSYHQGMTYLEQRHIFDTAFKDNLSAKSYENQTKYMFVEEP